MIHFFFSHYIIVTGRYPDLEAASEEFVVSSTSLIG